MRYRRDTPTLDRARSIVRPLIEASKPTRSRSLEARHGISHVIFETAIHCEHARLDGFEEAFATSPLIEEMAKNLHTKVSIHVLIEKLSPLFARVKDQSTRHLAALSKSELASIAFQGQRLLDEWASGDETVRRVRGHVVPPKSSAVEEEDGDESSLQTALERDQGSNP